MNYLAILLTCFTAFAFMQKTVQDKESDVITQILWYKMDLKDAQNQALFTRAQLESSNQIGGDLIYSIAQGVRAGILRPFRSDDMKERMMYDEFIDKLDTAKLFHTQDYHTIIIKKELHFSKSQDKLLHTTCFSKNLWSNIESAKKQGQSMDYEIVAMTILKEDDTPLATFGFAEIATNVLLDNDECVYWVSKEKQQKMNMFDALNHGLYEAQIIQYQHNEDNKIVKVQSENDIQILKSKYIPYTALASKIAFAQTFGKNDLESVFKKYQSQ